MTRAILKIFLGLSILLLRHQPLFGQDDKVSFGLIQPSTSPVIDLDLPKGTAGENLIYDMDGDGDNDFLFFAVGPTGGYKYIAYLNDGENNYKRNDLSYDFGISSAALRPIIRVADLNKDGINDIVIGGMRAGNSIKDLGPTKVFFGDAEGQLHYQSQIILPSTRGGNIRIEDFNNDTYPDIFLVSSLKGKLYLNDGSGSFSEAPLTGFTDAFVLDVAVSKPYNGGVDLIIEIFQSGFKNVIYRYESGVFTEVLSDFRTITTNHAIAFGDANADGYPDLFILDSDQRFLYLNDQSGSYTLDTTNDFDDLNSQSAYTLHFTDLNKDGAAEVVFAKDAEELAVFWNDGSGNYESHQTYEISFVGWVTVGDLNGDGFPDFVNNGNTDIPNPKVSSDELVTRVYINDRAGAFELVQSNIFPQFRDGDIQLLDANEDGHDDMLVSGAWYQSTESISELYLNDGTGEFTKASGLPFEGLEHASIAVADFNGDMHEDVVLSGLNQSDEVHTRLYLGDGAGSFSQDMSASLSGVRGASVVLDANGDTHPDLLVIGNDGADNLIAELYLNNGSGAMALHTAGLTGLEAVSVAVGDIDGDADADLLLQGVDATDTDRLLLYTNDGNGNFTEVTGHELEALADGMVLLLDIDGDEDLDVYLSGDDQFLIYTNDGTGNFTESQSEEGPSRSTAEFGDIDLDGDLDIVESGKYGISEEPRTFVYLNDGSGNYTRDSVSVLHGIFDGAIALGNLDQDSDLEIILSGAVWNQVTSTSRIYRNTTGEVILGTAPTITSFSPASGPVGTEVTIIGENFDATAANNTVYFGATKATVVSASATQLTVTVPYGATYEPITVFSNQLAAQSLTPFLVTFEGNRTVDLDSFDEVVTLDIEQGPNFVAVGDLDCDGLADLVVTNYHHKTLSIFRNASSGIGNINFEARVDHAMPGNPNELVLEDFNGDGKLDIVLNYGDLNALSIFQNTSDGSISFADRQDLDTYTTTSALASSDIDGDGRIDLIFTDKDDHEVHIYENNSTPGEEIKFTDLLVIDTGKEPRSVVVEDIDHDGKPDIITGNQTDETISVFLKDDTNFGFDPKQDIAVSGIPANLAVGDLDGDGITDFAISLNSDVLEGKATRLRLLKNNSTPGALSFAQTEVSTATNHVDLDDLDGDGRLDILVMELFNGLGFYKNLSSSGTITLDDESGLIHEGFSVFVETGDLDNDGQPDVIMPGIDAPRSILEIARNFGPANDFTSFSLSDQTSPATIDAENHSISIDVEDCTDPTSLVASFELSPGASAKVGTTNQQSGTTSNDFSSVLTYIVTAEDGLVQNWSVTVNATHFAEKVVENLTVCDSYEFDGNVLTTTGQYMGSFMNEHGCDSLVTLNLTVNESDNVVENLTVCDSYEFDGNVLTTTSQYMGTFMNEHGCDSLVTLNLTVHESDNVVENLTVCDSYEFDGNTLTATGQYIGTFMNEHGCDSLVTLNLTVNESDNVVENLTVCDSYEFDGNVLSATGQYMGTFMNEHGCDSLVTLNLTVNESDNVVENLTVCDSYEFDGNTLTTTGQYMGTLMNEHGCDSLVTLNLTVNESDNVVENLTVCDSYEFDGNVLTTTGQYIGTFMNKQGCDSLVTLNLTVNESDNVVENLTVCDSYEFDGNVLTTTGQYMGTFMNEYGCDSLVTLNLTVDSSDNVVENLTVCDSYEFDGNVLTTTGQYQGMFMNEHGCDSLVTLNLTVNESDNVVENLTVCDSYEFDGNLLTATGQYQGMFMNEHGCDSLVTLNLTVHESYNVVENLTVCDSYEFDGNLLTTTGQYMGTFMNEYGCDSLVTLNLTVNESDNVVENLTVCDSYEFDGNTLTTTGQYQGTFMNEHGCDSLVTLNLTVNESDNVVENLTVCDSYEFDGNLLTTTGQYMGMFMNEQGCDSLVTLNLTVNESNNVVQNLTVCDSYEFDGNTLTTTGQYQGSFMNEHGCDSLVTLNLTVNESDNVVENLSVCDSYEFDGNVLTATGQYQGMFMNEHGCDSLVTLNLTVNESDNVVENLSVCDSYEFDGNVLTTTGQYMGSFMNEHGCDSLVTLNLTVNESDNVVENLTVCDSYEFDGSTLTTTGQYMGTFMNEHGCDSLVTLNLTVDYSDNVVENLTVCDSYEFDGNTLTTTGQYMGTFMNEHGCDSLVTLNLTVNESDNVVENLTVCDSYEFDGNTLTTTGQYMGSFMNEHGCDSLVTLNLTVNESDNVVENLTVCDSYEFDGNVLTTTGQYMGTFMNEHGCDSLVTLNLTVNESDNVVENLTVCDSYEFDGNTLTTTGQYQGSFMNEHGCDSLVTLNLTVNESDNVVENLTVCDSYEFDGNLLTTTGQYMGSFMNEQGCDSLVTLNLTVNESDNVVENLTVCDSYEFDGNVLTATGQYQGTFMNEHGCDSLVTLNLTVNDQPVAVVEANGNVFTATEVEGATYQWYNCENDQPIEGETNHQLTPTQVGNYYVEVTSEGCSAISSCVAYDLILSIEEEPSIPIKLYPTLSDGNIVLELGRTMRDVDIIILSMDGREMSSRHFNSFSKGNLQIDGATGTYLIKVIAGGKVIYTGRVWKN